jgi:cytochrome P450
MVPLDPYGKEFVADPYPLYQRLRDEDPVHHNPAMKFWALTRYGNVYEGLRDNQTYVSGEGVTIEGTEKGMPYLIVKDPPQHSWHKGLAVKIFTRGRMARLEAFIRHRAIELLEELGTRDHYDWVEDFAARLPMDVISELTDIPQEYRDEIHRWTNVFILRGEDADPALIKESHRRRLEIFRELIKDRRRSPQDDVITLLMTAEIEDADGNPCRMSEEDIVYHYSELGNAGHETVARALPNCLLASQAVRPPRLGRNGGRRIASLRCAGPISRPHDQPRRDATRRDDPSGRTGADVYWLGDQRRTAFRRTASARYRTAGRSACNSFRRGYP